MEWKKTAEGASLASQRAGRGPSQSCEQSGITEERVQENMEWRRKFENITKQYMPELMPSCIQDLAEEQRMGHQLLWLYCLVMLFSHIPCPWSGRANVPGHLARRRYWSRMIVLCRLVVGGGTPQVAPHKSNVHVPFFRAIAAPRLVGPPTSPQLARWRRRWLRTGSALARRTQGIGLAPGVGPGHQKRDMDPASMAASPWLRAPGRLLVVACQTPRGERLTLGWVDGAPRPTLGPRPYRVASAKCSSALGHVLIAQEGAGH